MNKDRTDLPQPVEQGPGVAEPTLVELYFVLRRHWLIAAVCGLISGVSVFLLFGPQPKVEVLRASVEVGRRIAGDQPVIIEAPNVLLSRLNDVIIPGMLAERRAKGQFAGQPTVRMPDGGSVLTAEVTASGAMAAEAADLLEDLRARVRQALGPVVAEQRATLNGAIAFVQEENKARGEAITDLERRVAALRGDSVGNSASATQALVVAELRRDTLYRELLSMRREYQGGTRELRSLIAQRDGLRDTVDLGPPVREVVGGGRGIGQTLALAAIAAGVAAVVSALIAEYLRRVRQALRGSRGQ